MPDVVTLGAITDAMDRNRTARGAQAQASDQETTSPGLSEFPVAEYAARVERARRMMAAADIDCLFLTSNRNIRYFTGFYTQGWINPTRPRFFLLPREGEPRAIIPSGQSVGFRMMSWVQDVRTWPAPRPEDDGVSLILDGIRSYVKPGGRLGAEVGAEMRLEMPMRDYLKIAAALDGKRIVDCSPVTRPLRLVKSLAELDRMRRMAQIASTCFAQFPQRFKSGQTEREVYHTFHKLLAEGGADELPYVVPVSGAGGYHQINTGPSDRSVQRGDVLFVDICASLRGYFSDFDRNYAVGTASSEVIDTYKLGFEITQAGLEALRPGRTAADVFRAMAKVLRSLRGPEEPPGPRWGHGVGLDSAEPPSILETDTTELKEGVVLAIEPRLVIPVPSGRFKKVMYFEENAVITSQGYELLSTRESVTLPII